MYCGSNGEVWELRRVLSAYELREKGVRVLHRFGDKVVLKEALTVSVPGVSIESTTVTFTVPQTLKPDEIGELGFAYRQTKEFRAAKKQRPNEGVSFDDIIDGTAGNRN